MSFSGGTMASNVPRAREYPKNKTIFEDDDRYDQGWGFYFLAKGGLDNIPHQAPATVSTKAKF